MNTKGDFGKGETPIFTDLTLYKVIQTNRGRPGIFHHGGHFSMILKFSGLNSTDFTREDYASKFRVLQSAIQRTCRHPDISVQFLWRKKVNEKIEIDSETSDIAKQRLSYLNHLSENYAVFNNEFYIGIFMHNSSTASSKTYFEFLSDIYHQLKDGGNSSTGSVINERTVDGINERVSQVSEIVENLYSTLISLKFDVTIPQTEKEYYDIFSKWTRPSKHKISDIKIAAADDVGHDGPRRELFSGVRADVLENDFVLDDYFNRVYTLDRVPQDEIFGDTVDVLHGINAEFDYSVTFRCMTRPEALRKFNMAKFAAEVGKSSDSTIIGTDMGLEAEVDRITQAYGLFAYGNAIATEASINLVLRLHESYIEKLMASGNFTRAEIIRNFHNQLMNKTFSDFGSSEWVNEGKSSWDMYFKLIPGFSNIKAGILKTLLVTSDALPYLLGIYDSKRKIDGKGVSYFVDDKGTLVPFLLMDPTLVAANYVIGGQTGSGKSVIINTILAQLYYSKKEEEQPVVCILDLGGEHGSYRKLVELVGGTEINLSSIKKPCIQLFEINPEKAYPTPKKTKELVEAISPHCSDKDGDLDRYLPGRIRAYYDRVILRGKRMSDDDRSSIFKETFGFKPTDELLEKLYLLPGECEPNQDQANLILGVLGLMMSSSGYDAFIQGQADRDDFLMILQKTYQSFPDRFPFLTDYVKVAEKALDPNHAQNRKLLSKLKSWCSDSPRPFFDLPTDVDHTNNTILVDFYGISADKQLQAIYTMLFTNIFNEKMYFSKGKVRVIVRDEAWNLMLNDAARAAYEADMRTARKNGFATISASQSPLDYFTQSQSAGRAIIENTQVFILGKFAESAKDGVAQVCGLTEKAASFLPDLGQQKSLVGGAYQTTHSKFMVAIGRQVYVLNNYLHPYERFLYSSSPDENAIVYYYMKESKRFSSLNNCLLFLAENKHIGDKGLCEYLRANKHFEILKQIER